MINDVHLWSFMYHYYEMTYIHNHSYNFAGEAQCVSPATGLLASRWGHPRCSTGLGFFTSGQNSRGGIAMLKYLKVLGKPYGYGSIPIDTIFRGMNIHLPAILMFTRGTRFWHTAICQYVHCAVNIFYHGLTKTDSPQAKMGAVFM